MYLKLFVTFISFTLIKSEDTNVGEFIKTLPKSDKKDLIANIAQRILDEVEATDDSKEPKSTEIEPMHLDKQSAYVPKFIKENLKKNENVSVKVKVKRRSHYNSEKPVTVVDDFKVTEKSEDIVELEDKKSNLSVASQFFEAYASDHKDKKFKNSDFTTELQSPVEIVSQNSRVTIQSSKHDNTANGHSNKDSSKTETNTHLEENIRYMKQQKTEESYNLGQISQGDQKGLGEFINNDLTKSDRVNKTDEQNVPNETNERKIRNAGVSLMQRNENSQEMVPKTSIHNSAGIFTTSTLLHLVEVKPENVVSNLNTEANEALHTNDIENNGSSTPVREKTLKSPLQVEVESSEKIINHIYQNKNENLHETGDTIKSNDNDNAKPLNKVINVNSYKKTHQKNKNNYKYEAGALEHINKLKIAALNINRSAETQIEDSKLFLKIKSKNDAGKIKEHHVFETQPGVSPFGDIYKMPKQKNLLNVEANQNYEHRVPRPILQPENKQNNAPFFAPVYNYAPDSAYFNPYNKLGPNIKDFQTVKDHQGSSEIHTSQNYKVRSHDSPKYVPEYHYGPENAYYNPKNRLGPNLEESLEETDELHQPNNFKKYNTDVYKDNDIFIIYLNDLFKPNGGLNVNTPTGEDVVKFLTIEEESRSSESFSYERNINNHKKRKQHEGKSILKNSFEVFKIDLNHYDDENYNDFEYFKLNPNSEKAHKNHNNKAKPHRMPNTKFITSLVNELSNKKSSTKSEDKVDSYVNVLKNMIRKDDSALKLHNWLTSTVHVRSALNRISSLIEQIQCREPINPSDKELLKYLAYLHHIAHKDLLEVVDETANKEEKAITRLNHKGQRHRLLVKPAMKHPLNSEIESLERNLIIHLQKLGDFVDNLELSLYDLHEAIKNIATVTKYKKQNWYENLMSLYLSEAAEGDKKKLLELALHLLTERAIDLVEHDLDKFIDYNGYADFIQENREDVEKATEEIVLVSRLINEIKNLK